MNVGHPSNLARVVALYGGVMDELGTMHKPADMDLMRKELFSVSIPDEQTRETIRHAYQANKLMLEPHGAVGWAGLKEYFKANPDQDLEDQLCISLETAHPAKFPDEIQRLLGIVPTLPKSLEGLDGKKEIYEELPNNYPDFKEYLLKQS